MKIATASRRDLTVAARNVRQALDRLTRQGRPVPVRLRVELRAIERKLALTADEPDLHADPTFHEVIDPDVDFTIPYTEMYVKTEAAWTEPYSDAVAELVSDQLVNLDVARGNVSPAYTDLLDAGGARRRGEQMMRELRRDYAIWKAGQGPEPDWPTRAAEAERLIALGDNAPRSRSAFDYTQEWSRLSAMGVEVMGLIDEMEDAEEDREWDPEFLHSIAEDTDLDKSVRVRANASLRGVETADFLRDLVSGDRWEDDHPLTVQSDVEEWQAPSVHDSVAASIAFQQLREADDEKCIAAIEEIGLVEACRRRVQRTRHRDPRQANGVLSDQVIAYLDRTLGNPDHFEVTPVIEEVIGEFGPEYEVVGTELRPAKPKQPKVRTRVLVERTLRREGREDYVYLAREDKLVERPRRRPHQGIEVRWTDLFLRAFHGPFDGRPPVRPTSRSFNPVRPASDATSTYPRRELIVGADLALSERLAIEPVVDLPASLRWPSP